MKRILIILLTMAFLFGCAMSPGGGAGQAGAGGGAPTALVVGNGVINQTPYTENGANILPLSSFEIEEQMWMAYDQTTERVLADNAPAPFPGAFTLSKWHVRPGSYWYQPAPVEAIEYSTAQVKHGKTSLYWKQTNVASRIVTGVIPHDWTKYQYISFWMYSEKANSQSVGIACYSENTENGGEDDYFVTKVLVNWEGWKFIEIPFTKFTPTRKPVGWNKIDYIKIASSGWGGTALLDTRVYFDDMRLSDKSIAPDPLADLVVTFPDKPHPYLFGDEAAYANMKKKLEKHAWARSSLVNLKSSVADVMGALNIPLEGGGFYHDTSGATGDAALTDEHYKWARGARSLALLWKLEGNPEHLKRAKEILMFYAKNYQKYELHDKYGNKGAKATTGGRVTSQAMNEARWATYLVWAYDIVANEFTAAEQKMIKEDLFRFAAEAIIVNNEGVHNHQAWYNEGVGIIGFLLKEPKYVKYAIFSPDNGFLFQMKQSITEEGMWYEGSGHYHYYTMEPLLMLAEVATNAGINLYDQPKFRLYFSFPGMYRDPSWELPLINDGKKVDVLEGERTRWIEVANGRYNDPIMAGIISKSSRVSLEALVFGALELPEINTDRLPSMLLGGVLSVMRSNDNRLFATMNGMAYRGGHSHYDKLSITIYGGGKTQSPDSGSIKYRDPRFTGYFIQTVAHNTVTKDLSSQKFVGPAETVAFAPGPLAQLTWMKDNLSYPGSKSERGLLVTDWYFFDVFKISSPEAHQYHYVYRNIGKLLPGIETRPVGAIPIPSPPPGAPASFQVNSGFQFLDKLQGATLSGDHVLSWDLYDGTQTQLRALNGTVPTELWTAEMLMAKPVDDDVDPRGIMGVMLGRNTATTTYASMIVPAIKPNDYQVNRIALETTATLGENQAGAFSIVRAGVEDTIIYNSGDPIDAKAGPYKTDARIMFVRKKAGVVTDIFLYGASYLEFPDASIVLGQGARLRQPDSLVHLVIAADKVTVINQHKNRTLASLGGKFFAGKTIFSGAVQIKEFIEQTDALRKFIVAPTL